MLDPMLDEELAPCGRCRRATPIEAMRLWTTREHVRTLSRASPPRPPHAAPSETQLLTQPRPPTFRYATVTRVDAVCPACHGRLERGAALDGPERRRTWLTLALFLAIAALLVWGVPAILPNLIAAFWRNGAGGR